MKFRTKLFLWIGGLFLLAFSFSYYFETKLTEKFFGSAKETWKNYVQVVNEKKEEGIESFLKNTLSASLAKINTELRALLLSEALWSTFLTQNPEVGFVQFTKNSSTMSYVRPEEKQEAALLPLEDKNALIYVKESSYPALKEEKQGKEVYFLFDPSSQHLPPLFQGREGDFTTFPFHGESFVSPCLSPLEREEFQKLSQNFLASALIDTMKWEGILGVAVFSLDQKSGAALFKQGSCTFHSFFADEAYFHENLPPSGCAPISSGRAVISHPRFFIGNTAFINQGYLTIGLDLDPLLYLLSVSTEKKAFVLSHNEIYPPLDGVEDASFQGRTGEIMIDGVSQYFLKMTPLPDIDLHFLLLNPSEKEFALIKSITEKTKILVKEMTLKMDLIVLSCIFLALTCLHFLAKRFTKPIDELTLAAEKVGRGDLNVSIHTKVESKDEINLLSISFKNMVEGLIEKEKVRGVLNKVVSEEIAKEILKGTIHLGGEEKIVTVFFADIRSFTQITEKMPPQQVISFLNACMTKVSACIDKEGGVIDKYVGDEVMALFGAPLPLENSADKALLCALEIKKMLKAWNEEREKNKEPLIEMGIGIHTGPVIVGNMGAEKRLNYTAVGANVNLAARICSNALPGQILVTKETKNLSLLHFKELPPFTLKGFTDPIILYELLDSPDSG